MTGNGDTYHRRAVSDNAYQCGCRWIRSDNYGDVLVECAIHKRATQTSVDKFERERTKG